MLTVITTTFRRMAVTSNDRAVANAREATTAASRRRVEHTEVALFLADLAQARKVAASTASEHLA